MDFTRAPSTGVGLSLLHNLAWGRSTQGDQPPPPTPHGACEVPHNQPPPAGRQATCSPRLATRETLCRALLGTTASTSPGQGRDLLHKPEAKSRFSVCHRHPNTECPWPQCRRMGRDLKPRRPSAVHGRLRAQQCGGLAWVSAQPTAAASSSSRALGSPSQLEPSASYPSSVTPSCPGPCPSPPSTGRPALCSLAPQAEASVSGKELPGS